MTYSGHQDCYDVILVDELVIVYVPNHPVCKVGQTESMSEVVVWYTVVGVTAFNQECTEFVFWDFCDIQIFEDHYRS